MNRGPALNMNVVSGVTCVDQPSIAAADVSVSEIVSVCSGVVAVASIVLVLWN